MHSRLRVILAAALIAVLAFAAPGVALEKSATRITDLEHDSAWRGSSACSIIYYNTCTGWIWNWSGWTPEDVFGVSFDSCCLPGNTTSIEEAYIYFNTGTPGAGYGFTGTIDVRDAENTDLCPQGAVLASQPFLPVSGFNTIIFSGGVVVPDASFAMVVTTGLTGGNTMAISTDHPAAGPTGPTACGTCYPTTRVNRSFYWGTPASPLCPGSPLNDGICDAQFVWEVLMSCTTAVDQSSWGEIKSLYR